MAESRKIVFNTNLIFFVVFFIIFLGLGFSSLADIENDIALSVGLFAISAAPVFCIVISPIIYIFGDEHLTIVYCLGIKEIISWKEIRSVTKLGGWFFGKGKGLPVYEIVYPKRKKLPFFVESCVVSNKKTARLMKKYYKKNIKEYWINIG